LGENLVNLSFVFRCSRRAAKSAC